MGLLDQVLGDPRARAEHEDFVRRYVNGAPSEGFSGEEALARHQQAARHLSTGEYEQAALEALQRLSPKQRADFARLVEQHVKKGGGKDLQRKSGGGQVDAAELAHMVAGLQQQQPGLLGELLGGGGAGGVLGALAGGGAGSGGGAGGGMSDSPLARAALGGIAAMAVKRATASHRRGRES